MFGIDLKKINRRNLERRIKRKTKKLKAKLEKIEAEIQDRWTDFSEYDLDLLSARLRAMLRMVTK